MSFLEGAPLPTVDELVLRISGDPTGLKTAIAQSSDAIRSFGRVAETELAGLNKLPANALTGYTAATDLLTGLKAKLAENSSQIREFLFKGILTREEFVAKGRTNSLAFNEALLSGLADLRGRGILLPEIEQMLVRELRDDGLKAGEAANKAIQSQLKQIRPPDLGALASPLRSFALLGGQVGEVVSNTGNEFSQLSKRAGPALTAVSFGFESLVRGAAAGESGVRSAARAVGTFANGFGPEGFVVSALIAGGIAITEYFAHAREEAAATTKAVQSDLAAMFNAGQLNPLQNRLKELQLGRPSVNAGIEDAPSGKEKDAGLIVKGGLAALQQQLRDFEQQYDYAVRTHNVTLFNSSQKGVRELQAQIAPIAKAYGDVQRAIFQLPADIGSNGSLGTVTVRASNPAKAAVKELKDSRAELSALTATIGEEGLAAFTQTGFGERLAADYRDALDLLRRQPDQLGPDALGLRRLLDQNADAITKALGGPGKPVQSTLQLLPAAGVPTVAIAPAATESVNRYVTAFGKLNPTLHNLQLGADAVRDISDAFGQGGRQVADFANEVSGLATSIQTLQSGNTSSFTGLVRGLQGVGGIVGTVASLAGTIGGLFGKSPAEKARDAAIENNTQALERVRGSLDRSFSSGTNLDATRAAIAAYLSPSNAGLRKTLEQDAGKSVHADTELGKFLAAFHLTSDQLVALASSYGITIFQNGKVVTDALKDLGEAIAATSTSLTTFGTDFAGQDAAKQLRDKLFGKTNATDTLSRELEELAQFAPSLGKAFQGLDTTTEAGRAQIRTALQQLYLEIQNGALSLADLGSFTSIADLLSVIGGTSDALDALSSAANDVSGALRNVPQGFKVAAATFAATDAQIRALIPPSRAYPTPLPTDPTFGQLQPAAAAFTFASGAIVIQGASKSADQLLDEIALAAQRRAAGYGGTYTPADMFALGGAGAARSAA